MPFFRGNVRLHFHMCFVPQFTEATGIITLESVIFSMEFCMRIYKKFIASSSNNAFYIQIHHFTQQTMLNQTLYYHQLTLLLLFSPLPFCPRMSASALLKLIFRLPTFSATSAAKGDGYPLDLVFG